MTETKRRIEEYKSKLPKMKEKVAAAIALLLVGAAMMTTVSFAWLAISVNPEVSGVTTALASNGNLEIALASGTQLSPNVPGATQLGDSNKENLERNITWGNLINLSDPAYGLENLVLRPAQLNKAELLTNPLYGALYTPDGRLEKLDSSFGYTKWDVEKQMFVHTSALKNQLGVRAISSVTKDFSGAQKVYNDLKTEAKNKNIAAGAHYANIANDTKKMQSLATMMGLFMTARMNPDEPSLNNPECKQEDLQNLRDMYAEFKTAMEMEADAIAAALNFQSYIMIGEGYTAYTADDVFTLVQPAASGDFVKNLGSVTVTDAQGKTSTIKKELKITNLALFIKDYNTVSSDLVLLQELASRGGTIKWSDSGLSSIVNRLTDVGKCTIGADNTPISSIGASNAMGYLSGTQEARITNGILYNFEKRTGGYIEVKNLSISATVKRMGMTVPATVKANVQTTAPRDENLFTNDLNYGDSMFTKLGGTFEGGDVVANDTYALAIDLWVRTNAAGGFLTLEGNVLTKSEDVLATGKDAGGNEVTLYELSRTTEVDGESTTLELTLYKIITEDKENEGKTITTWYQAETHAEVELKDGETPLEKMVTVTTVIGYDGANRIWEGEPGQHLTVNSTTQGSGSCYVFYPANSEDQDRTIELLKSFKVAFVDGDGKLLAIATMDTDMRYEQPGKVIVPLKLDPSNSIEVGEDTQGNKIRAITALEKNVATRITAIVYLDGLDIGNEDVLSAAEIQGQMNIQFGSTALLKNAENEDLKYDEISITANLDKTEFNYDEASEQNPMTTNVSLTITGDQPKNVTGYFFRKINDTQGSREQLMTFTDPDGDGVWTASYTFTSPGKYVFRSVQVDGTERELSGIVENNYPSVKVNGFTITELSFPNNSTVMTAASSHTEAISIAFASSDVTKMPQSVEARFRRDDGTVAAAVFTYNTTTHKWTSDVKFTFSGTYYLNSVYLDGIEQPIEGMEKQITLSLGMYVKVYTVSPTSFKYVPDEMADNEKNLAMQVKIFDNAGNEMPALAGVQLNYAQSGSGTKKMNADVVWNAATGYYEGTFSSLDCIGIFKFSNVKVGANVITSATTSPTFTILSPNPPELISNTLKVADNGISFEAEMKYTEAATVVGYINKVDKDGKILAEYEVQGTGVHHLATETREAYSTWTFNIPADNNGNRDGRWQFVGIKVWNYYDANGDEQSAPLDANGNIIKDAERGTPAEFNVTLGPIKIAKVPYVTFTDTENNKSQSFGKDADGNVTGAFMQSYPVSGLEVKVVDFEGEPFRGNVNVNLYYDYDGKSADNGGYTSESLIATNKMVAIGFEVDGSDATKYVQSADVTFLYAGGYTPTLEVTVNGSTVTYSGKKAEDIKAPSYSVWSTAPTVKMTSAYYANDNMDENSPASAITNGSSTTVYYKTSQTEICNVGLTKNYDHPYVVINIEGLGRATKATLTFVTSNTDGTVHLYTTKNNGTGQTSSYEWTANGTCTRYVGYCKQIDNATDDKAAAGTLTATTLVLTYDGKLYSFSLPQSIVINNPR